MARFLPPTSGVRQRLILLIAAAALVPGFLSSSVANAAPPTQFKDVDVVAAATQGASMRGNVWWISPVSIAFEIVVTDTARDSQCANLYLMTGARYGWSYLGHACGSGSTKTVSKMWNLGGSGAGWVSFGICRDGSCTSGVAVDNNSYGQD